MKSRKHNFKDLTGKRFGKLVVERLYESATRENKLTSSKWKVKCDCGGEKIVLTSSLTRGHTKSCGCLHTKRMSELTKLEDGECNFNLLLNKYKRSAINRTLNFSLTKEQFKFLTKQNCHYCGKIPMQQEYTKGSNGKYIYNGIDRKDNLIGYEIENCVTCCKVCNIAKSKTGYDDFINFLDNLVEYRIKLKAL